MHSKILPLLSLVALSHAANIACSTPSSRGLLYYSAPNAQTYIGQLGIVEARGNAEMLEKYPHANVIAHNVSITPCSSTGLDAVPNDSSTPVLVKLEDDPSKCLGLISAGINAEVSIIKLDCQSEDTRSAQLQQFWTQDKAKKSVVPQWAAKPSDRWLVEFSKSADYEVLASPPSCDPREPCQNGTHYSISVRDA